MTVRFALLLVCAATAAYAPAQRPAARVPPPAVEPAAPEAARGAQEGFAPVPAPLGEPFAPLAVQVRGPDGIGPDPRAALRAAAQRMLAREAAHRDRVARLERVRALLAADGDASGAAEAVALLEREAQRFGAAQRVFERELSPRIHAQLRAVLDAQAGPRPAGWSTAPDGRLAR
ncbi:MAG: hypothetical protein JNK02_13390 [Planctomycetes bacterium]|nr:hypothetical protein [Planctomycetota bacterium]